MDNRELLFVVGSMGSGGAERVASIIANHLVKRGWRISIAMLLDGTIYYELDPAIALYDFSRPNKKYLLNVLHWVSSLRKLNKKKNFRASLAFFLKGGLISRYAFRGTATRVIARESEDPRHSRRGRVMMRVLDHNLAKIDAVVFQSEYQKNCYPKAVSDKGKVILNPVVVPTLHRQCKKENLIVSVGRLIDGKRYDVLVEAFALFSLTHPSFTLKIFGEGSARDAIAKHIASLGLSDKALLMGNSKDVLLEMSKAQVFVLTSDAEGQPNALIEAMLLGVPSISSRWNGVDDIISDGIDGLIVDKGDIAGFAVAMSLIIDDSSLSRKLSQNAIAKQSAFSIEKIVEEWETLIIGADDHGK